MKQNEQSFEFENAVSRRRFLQLMGASVALAGLDACTRLPDETITAYSTQTAAGASGQPLHYATSFSFDGYAQGVLAESRDGRPAQLRGHPRHPASLGACSLFMQASLLSLYDPERSHAPTFLGQTSTDDAFGKTIKDAANREMRILTGTVTSPSLASQLRRLLAARPNIRWHAYQPVNADRQKEAARVVFGRDLMPVWRFEKARTIVSIGADFLGAGPAQLAYSRAYAEKREPGPDRNRLYVIESSISVTGASADHRLNLRPSLIDDAILTLARELGVTGLPAPRPLARLPMQWLQAAARDLLDHPKEAAVVAGAQESVSTQILAYAIQERLGGIGRSLVLISPPDESAARHDASLEALVSDMNAGRVSALLVSDCNPAYAAPGGLDFARALEKVPLGMHHGLYRDETAALCHWHVPAAHFLESWGDARAYDGTVSLQQPLIAPLHGGRSLGQLLAPLDSRSSATTHALLEAHWRERHSHASSAEGFEPFFARAIQTGLLEGTAFKAEHVSLHPGWRHAVATGAKHQPEIPEIPEFDVVLRPDPTIWDGRYGENAWLQELPKPLLQLTWSNAALVSPATAQRMGLADGDTIELSAEGRAIEAPVLQVPGHADGCVTLPLGYGRTRAGVAGSHRGFSAYPLLGRSTPPSLAGVRLRKIADRRRTELALVHDHHSMEGRDLVRHGTLAALDRDATLIVPLSARKNPPSLLDEPATQTEEWAMVIDLNRCTGCNACIVACQAENNIPVVGEDEVKRGREMHWIRVDRYIEASADGAGLAGSASSRDHDVAAASPAFFFQPVPCMHCETAPCELVCPTGATNHSSDGLNQMTYNRCVGTRYCSNNCPYKVRRFNFFEYADLDATDLTRPRNPEVTLRSRGVMEKCTYCVQRIQAGRIEAERQARPIRDGEIQTACQQACPSRAIVFGNKSDRSSEVARLRQSARGYALLGELGTRPRTTYLARITNPNPTVVA